VTSTLPKSGWFEMPKRIQILKMAKSIKRSSSMQAMNADPHKVSHCFSKIELGQKHD